jgi:hypothetical protein
MPWLLIKYVAPAAIVLGLGYSVISHLNEHSELKVNNADLTAALEATEKVNDELVAEIDKRDAIIASNQSNKAALTNQLRRIEGKISRAVQGSPDSVIWGDSRMPNDVFNLVYEATNTANTGEDIGAGSAD